METSTLQLELEKLRRCRRAENTLKSYAQDWSLFERWCRARNASALPATGETVALYITQQIAEHHRMGTVRCRLSAIRYYHRISGVPVPAGDQVRELLAGARRVLREQPRCKNALRLEDLKRICAAPAVTALEIRNRAIVLFGFASALRRSEIARMEYSDIQNDSQGLLVRLRWEKQDQEGKGRDIAICFGSDPTMCPVAALRAWLAIRGDKPGFLFLRFNGHGKMTERGFTGEVIHHLLQEEVKRTGLDQKLYGAHSMRAGFITESHLRGASETRIARHTGHRSMQSLQRYFRPRDPFENGGSGMAGL